MSPEAAMIARAVHERRPLASVIGVPQASLEAARALARWAGAIGEPHLAIAAWEGCAALDDAPSSWLGLADAALAAGDARRAFEAAARACAHPAATRADRDRAALASARACLCGGLDEDARAWLRTLTRETEPEVARMAGVIEEALGRRR